MPMVRKGSSLSLGKATAAPALKKWALEIPDDAIITCNIDTDEAAQVLIVTLHADWFEEQGAGVIFPVCRCQVRGVADLLCPVHGIDGTDPFGDGQE